MHTPKHTYAYVYTQKHIYMYTTHMQCVSQRMLRLRKAAISFVFELDPLKFYITLPIWCDLMSPNLKEIASFFMEIYSINENWKFGTLHKIMQSFKAILRHLGVILAHNFGYNAMISINDILKWP